MYKQLIALVAVLLLVGAGCAEPAAPTDTVTPTTKDAGVEIHDAMKKSNSEVMEAVAKDMGIMLSADATDTTQIAFAWSIPEGTEYDAFYLVRGEEMDPVNDGKNYWFRQYYTRRAVSWEDQPAGTWHYRICGVIDDECSLYSNNIELTVE
jgi:hypothetical protein